METHFMVYLTDSPNAVDFYQKAFNAQTRNAYKDDDGTYMHVEIVKNGQFVLAIMECKERDTGGMNMQFWITFDTEEDIRSVYVALKEDAKLYQPLDICPWSNLMADLTDKYGVRWLLSYWE